MHKLSIHNTEIAFDLDTETVLHVHDPLVLPLIHSLDVLHGATPLGKVTLMSHPGLGTHDFAIVTVDGRMWQQVLRQLSGNIYEMTVDAPDFWRFSLFQLIRDIRDKLMEIDRIYHIDKFSCKW